VEDIRFGAGAIPTIAERGWWFAFALWLAATAATAWIRPEVFTNLWVRPWTFILVLTMLAGGAGVFYFLRRQRDLAAFLSSSAFIVGILAATMAGTWPNFLRSTMDPSFSVTAFNSAAGAHGLRVAAAWWILGMALAAGYFVFLFRNFRGKVQVDSHETSEDKSSVISYR